MFNLKWRLRSDLITVCNFLVRESRTGGPDLCSLVPSDGTQENGLKLLQGKFRWYIRKKFFTESVVRHWNRLPKEVVTVPSFSVFEKHSLFFNF